MPCEREMRNMRAYVQIELAKKKRVKKKIFYNRLRVSEIDMKQLHEREGKYLHWMSEITHFRCAVDNLPSKEDFTWGMSWFLFFLSFSFAWHTQRKLLWVTFVCSQFPLSLWVINSLVARRIGWKKKRHECDGSNMCRVNEASEIYFTKVQFSWKTIRQLEFYQKFFEDFPQNQSPRHHWQCHGALWEAIWSQHWAPN